MTDWHNSGNDNPKPGCNIAFGGGTIVRHRKVHDVPKELIQETLKCIERRSRSGWSFNYDNYRYGQLCNQIAKFLNHGDWGTFQQAHLSHVSESTTYRARKIAEKIDMDKYPAFCAIDQDPLFRMLKKYTVQEAVNLLEENGAEFAIGENDTKEIYNFQCLFKQLLKGGLDLLPGEGGSLDSSSENENYDQLSEEPDSQFTETEPDPLLESCVSYINNLHQLHDDTGELLDEQTVSALANILVETCNVLWKFGPKVARGKKFQKILTSLEDMQEAIAESQLDEGLDAGDSDSDNTCEDDHPTSRPTAHDKTSNPNIYSSFNEIEDLTTPPQELFDGTDHLEKYFRNTETYQTDGGSHV